MRASNARPPPGLRIVRNPPITPGQLHAFYTRTGVCEAGFSPPYIGRVLTRSDAIFAAYKGDTLVGLARALCDGTTAYVVELCVDPAFQGLPLHHSNASVIERDRSGVGRWLGAALLRELRKQGATFFSVYAIEGIEERFYKSLGFEENVGHKMYYIDLRDYVSKAKRGGKLPILRAGNRARRSHLRSRRPRRRVSGAG